VLDTSRLFESATESGARSLQGPGGSLEAGKAADFFTIDLNDCSVAGAVEGSLLAHVVFSLDRTAVRDVCVAGKMMVEDGRHRLKEEIVREFGEVQRKLWQ
jgi:formimidoylglutamate deiminase